ncbi:MAG: VWA domain-containing protein, partial [Rhodospirillales bacterium]
AQALAEAEATAAPPPPRVEPSAAGRQRVRLAIDDLDLVFVMDTTGSMRSELRDLQASLIGMIGILSRLSPSLRIGFVAFRDRTDAYLTRTFPIAPIDDVSAPRLVAFVNELRAGGGGDIPEAVDEGLRVATAMAWRDDVRRRIIVIGDAPVHAENHASTLELVRRFRRSAAGGDRPRSVSAIVTGRTPAAQAFFRDLAEAGGGDFSVHQGQMIESVLLSVLPDARREAAGR